MAKNDTVERLAGGIAHDFDALLTAIIGHADNLGDYLSPGDPRAAQVHAIRQAAERASSLTQQLLAFSRTQTLHPTTVDLNAAIARARHGLQRVLGDRISLDTRPASGVWAVRADPDQLEQVLHHLAVNARGAMSEGGALVVSMENTCVAAGDPRLGDMEPGEYVELSITDTGDEIQPTAQQHLFEPFFPAPSRPRSNGLGLAMVYGAVKQSGGHITVESPLGDDGRGTRFRIYLPAARGECGAAAPAPSDGAGTVLLLGDDPHVQAFIVDVLKRRGYRLLLASDAWDAMQAADREPAIDLLITTGADGALVADAVQERRPATRVLHVSASAADAPPVAARDGRAARAILAQPFTPAALAKKVRAVLA